MPSGDGSASERNTREEGRFSRDSERPAGSYTIDDLAALTSVPSRTIRFYQAKGALAAPVRKGRVAYYDDSHAERLRLVAHLQDRGLNLRAIRDLLQRADSGEVSVAEWLGVGEQLQAPWSEDRPRIFTEEEIAQLAGGTVRPGLIAEFLRTGLLRRETNTSPGSYFVSSPGMLQIALRLEAAGVDIETAHLANEILRKQLARAADELVVYFVKRAEDAAGPDEVARSIGALRSVGVDVVRLVFAQEIERALREAVEGGRVMPPTRKKRR
jgi:DNA-binding transcriptional MerR regulator